MIKARLHLKGVPSCPHGSLPQSEMAKSGLVGREIIDFSASCNPLGAAPSVLAALRDIDPSRYPEDGAPVLRRALAEKVGADSEGIVVGNGSVELMWLLAMAYLEPGERALVAGPTFGEYARACQVVGGCVLQLLAREENGFALDLKAFGRAIDRERPRLAFLCNPNNPTGQRVTASDVEELLEHCDQTLLVVDEAYLPFCDAPPNLMPLLSSGRLLLLRSMTKDHGLAGLRLGYAVARPSIIEDLNRVRLPWNVSVAAEQAGLAALRERQHVERARRVVVEGRAYLSRELSGLGLRVIPSVANFVLVRVGEGSGFRAVMMNRGICVRDCTSFGLPSYVRIGIRTLPECQMLVAAVRGVLADA